MSQWVYTVLRCRISFVVSPMLHGTSWSYTMRKDILDFTVSYLLHWTMIGYKDWNMNICCYIFFWKKSIFDHPTIARVCFWPLNSKTGYLRPSNYQNRSLLAIRRFCRAVSLTWTPRGGGAHLSAILSPLSLSFLRMAVGRVWGGYPRISGFGFGF